MEDLLRWLFEPHEGPRSFTVLEMSLRALGIYLAGWAILRIGGNRFLGRETVFDIVLAFVLGSTLSRAINGSAPLAVTLAASALLVVLHHLLAWLTWRSHGLGVFFKGRPQALIRDGQTIPRNLRRYRISKGDLDEALRLHAHLDDPGQVKEARFERNGDISFVKKKGEPQVVEVRVEQGVQTVRIEIGGS
ncbi:MAG TPA: YetF domain-containing protein [Thermoanaerobaculia bacterium]|nr:YetF domain-containing protein [Thermoanaerobaculia bacterium]